MHLLLLNNNPAVSRLIKLSVEKVGDSLDEFDDYGLVPLRHYDVVMVDNESYDEEALMSLCESSECQYVIYVCQRGSKKPDFANVALEKPFLPTDFLALLDKVRNVLQSLKTTEIKPKAPTEQVDDTDMPEPLENFGEDMDEETKEPAFDLNDIDQMQTHEETLEELEGEEEDPLVLPEFHEEEDETFDTLPVAQESMQEKDEPNPFVLDKDDIDEVKQLLDESEDTSSLDEDEIETDESDTMRLEEPFEEDESLMMKEANSEALDVDAFESVEEPVEDDEQENDDVVTYDEEPSLVLEESMAERSEEDNKEEWTVEKSFDEPIKEDVSQMLGFESLDDLDEIAIRRALGEEVAPEESEMCEPEMKEDAEIIRGEIEKSISHSLSTLAQSEVLREALKGMRINISITFDDKN